MTGRAPTPSPHVASIGARLRRLRKDRGLTQSDLACQIGIQQSDLSRIEKGEYRVSLDNLIRILNVFGVQIGEFFGQAPARQTTTARPLSQEDMQVLHLLRQLSEAGRHDVLEYAEFKLRREQQDQRAIAVRRDGQGTGS